MCAFRPRSEEAFNGQVLFWGGADACGSFEQGHAVITSHRTGLGPPATASSETSAREAVRPATIDVTLPGHGRSHGGGERRKRSSAVH